MAISRRWPTRCRSRRAGALAATNGTVTVRPLTRSGIDLAGANGGLSLDETFLSRLSGRNITIGGTGVEFIHVHNSEDPIVLHATNNATLLTGAEGSITVNTTVKSTNNLSVTTDNLTIESGGKLAGANVTLSTATNGRNIEFGAAGDETFLGLDTGEIGRIATPGTFTVSTGGTLTVSNPVEFAAYAAGPDTGINNLTLLANSMAIDNTVELTGNGTISVAPSGFTSMTLGADSGGLALTAAEINRLRTGGALRLGSTGRTSSIFIAGSINAGNVGSLTLAASGSISQDSDALITADRLRLQSNGGAINLAEGNHVGRLAGGNNSFSSFIFGNDGSLAIGQAVDGVSGLQGFNIDVRAGNLALSGPGTIGNGSSTVRLAPFDAGAAMNLGTNQGGVFSVDGDELARIAAFNLTFGNNTTGTVNVTDAMQRSSGTLNIVAAPTATVNVGGALAGPSGVSIDAGTINVSRAITSTSGSVNLNALAPATLNIDAQVSAGNDVNLSSDVVNIRDQVSAGRNVNVISDAVNITAPVVSSFGTVSIAPITAGRGISLGTEAAGELGLTQGELGLISAPGLSIGNSVTGPITIRSGISTGVGTLSLTSAGAITQTAKSDGSPGTPIIFTGLDTLGQRVGNLVVSAGGAVNLGAANEVPGFLSGSAANGSADFVFNNQLPMRLHFVGVGGVQSGVYSVGGGRILINAGPFVPSPIVVGGPEINVLPPEIISSLNDIAKLGQILKDNEPDSKDDKKKTQVCN